RVARGVAGDVGRQRLSWPGNAEPAEDFQRLLASAVGGEITRRFRQREAENPDNQRAAADDEPDPAPHIVGRFEHGAEPERERGADRPNASATDEMHDGEDAAADALG